MWFHFLETLMYALLVEGGKTKTLAVLVDEEGNVLGVSVGGSSGWTAVGLDNAISTLTKTVTDLITNSGLKKEIDIGIFGIPDLDTERTLRLFEGSLSQRIVGIKNKIIVPDFVVAYYAVTLGAPGVAVIAGTGSIAYGKNSKGEDARAGGWGWFGDDEGSALWIAMRSVAAVGKSWDGRGPPTVLTEKILKHFGLTNPIDLIDALYSTALNDLSKLAQIARLTDEAAEEGDEVAMNILIQGGKELALMAKAVQEKILAGESHYIVGGVGSVFSSKTLRQSFLKHIKEQLPEALITEPLVRYTPIKGTAAILHEKWHLPTSFIDKVTHYFSSQDK
jgi:N-acetylglucosamine kinase-like BadF-type ATPase